ncbi:MAG: hypothetical protein QOJ94_1456 [Sphingomonadales bacterium]|jgi:hypothetical protein|nr:hypothetical protein [Sphingomonadales bacterium]
MKNPLMLPVLAALLAAAQPPQRAQLESALGRTAWVFATIGHSEWCPAGNVRLDLVSGRYELTGRASRRVCGQRRLERPVVAAQLGGARLDVLRAAYRRVLAEGLESPECREGKHPDMIVISNGGTPILVVATGALTMAARDDLTCWSGAANALHGALDEAFSAAHQR